MRLFFNAKCEIVGATIGRPSTIIKFANKTLQKIEQKDKN